MSLDQCEACENVRTTDPDFCDSCLMAMIDARVSAILQRENVTEASGEWSMYDIARALDPSCAEPRHMFDSRAAGAPDPHYIAAACDSLARLKPPARYVGGTSVNLYHVKAAATS